MSLSEELTAKIDSLRSDYEKLQKAVGFVEVTKQLGDVATQIQGLPGKIAAIRQAGYVYASYLEHKAKTLGDQWTGIHQQINDAIRTELGQAQAHIEELDELWDALEDAIEREATPASPKPSKRSSALSAGIRAALEESQQDKQADLIHKLGALGGQSRPQGGMGSALAGATGGESSDSSAKAAGANLADLAGGGGKSAASGALAGLAGAGGKSPSSDALSSLAKKASNLGKSDDTADIEKLTADLATALGRVNTAIANAKSRIDGLYGEVPANVSQTQSQLREIETYLSRAQQATFEFLAGEDIYMVVEAEWKQSGNKKDNPDGFLYITSQRLIMEQQEKKGGFVGFGGKKVEGVAWESPIGAIDEIKHEKKGMLGGIDLVHLRFGSGGPFGETTIEVKGGINAEWFANRLRRAVKGEIEGERGVAHDPAIVEVLSNAPTMCSVCGANFNQPITKGMTQMECAYCGAVVRLRL
jgi:hypothetical protein